MANKPPLQGVADFRPPEHRSPLASPTQSTTMGARPAGDMTGDQMSPGRPMTPGGQPYIDPGAMPAVAAYVEGMADRAAARAGRPAPAQAASGLPKYNVPVGGAPAPPIPRLDGAHATGQTMTAQAEDVNSPPMHQQMAAAHAQQAPGSIVEPALHPPMPVGAQPQRPRTAAEAAQALGLQPTDMLPHEAQQDPEFQRGNGAMFAVSQPGLAARYGVVRNGQRIMPQQLKEMVPTPRGQAPARDGLRPETLQGLKDLQDITRRQALAPEQRAAAEAAAEAEVKEGPAGASSNAGAPPAGSGRITAEEAQRRVELMDSFDYDALRDAINEDILRNPDQKKIIEDRLEALDIDDLIIKNRVMQRVPIIPKKFEVTYRSMTGNDDLALKRLLMQESKSVEVTERFLLDKYAFMALSCGIVKVNSNALPDHLDAEGKFNEEAFWKKFEWVMKRPLHMLSSIGVNHTWFEMRVRKLFVAENVGNI